MTAADTLIPSVVLNQWATKVLERSGVLDGPAAVAAHCLVRTSLRGVDTHGISRLPAYAEKLLSGEVNAKATPKFDFAHGLLRCDGDGGLGQAVASEAVERAMALAQKSAVVACTLHSAGHLAALGAYVLKAAEQGMVALLCQRTPPIMSLPGATARAIGNNPLAFALPVKGKPPFVFDMAHSVVARGRLMQAAREHQEVVPVDWAIGPDGTPTTNPTLALLGAMQPIAGHKGMGLAMMVECLAGSLSDPLPQRHAEPAREGGSPSHASAFLLVVNPALAIGQETFDRNVEAWLGHYLQTSGADARYPGQRQAQCESERRLHGIPVTTALGAELHALGGRLLVPFAWK